MPTTLVLISKLSLFTEDRYASENSEARRILKKGIYEIRFDIAQNGMNFLPIPEKEMEVVIAIDASFGVNFDKSSQSGIIVMIRDKTDGTANIMHYSSAETKRVRKSVLSAELFALVHGFDIGFLVSHTLSRILGRQVELSIYTESLTLYGLCVSLSQTTEHRLQIDLAIVREAYECRDIINIILIPGSDNPADDLTKVGKRCGALTKLKASNKLNPEKKAWIERDKTPVQKFPAF